MRSEYIGSYRRDNGFSGRTIIAHLCLMGNRLIEVYPHGYNSSPFLQMDFTDKSEAVWHIDNHPNGKYYS